VPYTPVELRHVRIGRALLGFRRDETLRLIEEVADSFEAVWRDRGELADKVEELERVLAEFKQREQLLSQTLVAAERAATEARDAARRDAELIVAEAHQEARSVKRGAQSERERLIAEARRVRTLLRSALGLIDESVHEEERPEPWPDRHDTREFAAIQADAPESEPETDPPLEEDAADDVAPSRDFTWG
jgi:cell division initiation protein